MRRSIACAKASSPARRCLCHSGRVGKAERPPPLLQRGQRLGSCPPTPLRLVLADLDVDPAVVLADLAGETRYVDLHHRLMPAFVIEIGKDAQGHDRGPQQHAKQKIVALAIQIIRHEPLHVEFAPQSMFYRRLKFPSRLWLSLTRIKEEDQSHPRKYSQPGEASMLHQVIETLNSRVALRPRYENFIGGKWVAPVDGGYFDNVSPITGKTVCQIARSQAADIELALDAAHKAKDAWGKTAPAKRAEILNKIADRMEENLKVLAAVETIDNGKPIRETTFADIPLAIDHFRYFAACIRSQEGSLGELDHDTIAYHYHEPLGVVGQIIPWNFPILMATWQLRYTETGGADSHEHHGADGSRRRPPAARRAQRGQRLWGRGRQAARPEQAHRQGRLYRRDHHWALDHAICVSKPDPGHARARRQVAQHLLRRRDGRRR